MSSHNLLEVKSCMSDCSMRKVKALLKCISLATYLKNKIYYSSRGCSPTLIFHCIETIEPLDARLSNQPIKILYPKSDLVTKIKDARQTLSSEMKSKLCNSYHQYRRYFGEKSAAQMLKLFSVCLFLNPQPMSQNDFRNNLKNAWIPWHRV